MEENDVVVVPYEEWKESQAAPRKRARRPLKRFSVLLNGPNNLRSRLYCVRGYNPKDAIGRAQNAAAKREKARGGIFAVPGAYDPLLVIKGHKQAL